MAATRRKSGSKSRTTGRKRKASSSRKSAVAQTNRVSTGSAGQVVVHVDETNRRDDLDAVVGRPAEIKKGDNSGTRGYIYEVASYDKDGFPVDVSFRPANSVNVLLNEKYENIDALPQGSRLI